jgi:hypothetical protein
VVGVVVIMVVDGGDKMWIEWWLEVVKVHGGCNGGQELWLGIIGGDVLKLRV